MQLLLVPHKNTRHHPVIVISNQINLHARGGFIWAQVIGEKLPPVYTTLRTQNNQWS